MVEQEKAQTASLGSEGRRLLVGASISEISDGIDQLVLVVKERYPGASVLEFYQRLADAIPYHIRRATQEEALQAIFSSDPDVSRAGRKTLLFLRLGTIMTAIKPFLSGDCELDNDIVQGAIIGVYERLGNLKLGDPLPTYIHGFAQLGAAGVIAARENMPIKWFMDSKPLAVKARVEAELGRYPLGLPEKRIAELAEELSSQTRISRRGIEVYVRYKNSFVGIGRGVSLDEIAGRKELSEVLRAVLEMFGPRDQKILGLRYGLSDGQKRTLDEIAREFNLTGEGVRLIELRALRKLRRRLARRLEGFLE